MMSRRVAISFGVSNACSAAALAFGVFAGLPARWVPVDAIAGFLIAAEAVSAVLLLRGTKHAATVAAVVSGVVLLCGLGVVTALALTASWLAGVYGPVGRGGAAILALVALLVVPYFIALPAIQLAWASTRQPAP